MLALTSRLAASGWIDLNTRAVFLELAVFNANSELFTIMTFLVEILPTGQFLPFLSMNTVRMIPHFWEFNGDFLSGTQVADLVYCALFVIALCVFIGLQVRQMFKQRLHYIMDVWNYWALLLIASGIACIVFFVEITSALNDLENQFTRTANSVHVDFLPIGYLMIYLQVSYVRKPINFIVKLCFYSILIVLV